MARFDTAWEPRYTAVVRSYSAESARVQYADVMVNGTVISTIERFGRWDGTASDSTRSLSINTYTNKGDADCKQFNYISRRRRRADGRYSHFVQYDIRVEDKLYNPPSVDWDDNQIFIEFERIFAGQFIEDEANSAYPINAAEEIVE